MLFKGTESIGPVDRAADAALLEQVFRVGRESSTGAHRGERADPEQKVKPWPPACKTCRRATGKCSGPTKSTGLYTMNGAVGLNASTGQDVTTYHVSLPMNRIVALGQDRIGPHDPAVFREFYSERDVVLEERRADAPTRTRKASSTSGSWPPHLFPFVPKAHSGWPSDITFFDRRFCCLFLLHHHARTTPSSPLSTIRPDNVLAPDRAVLRRHPPAGDSPRPSHRGTAPGGERRIRVHFDARPQLMIGWHKRRFPTIRLCSSTFIEARALPGRTSGSTGNWSRKRSGGKRRRHEQPARSRYPIGSRSSERPGAAFHRGAGESTSMRRSPGSRRSWSRKRVEKVKNRMRADSIRERLPTREWQAGCPITRPLRATGAISSDTWRLSTGSPRRTSGGLPGHT